MLTNVSRRAARFLNGSALTRPLFMLGAASAMLTPAFADPLAPNTIPEGGNVVGGSASITHAGSTLTVNQGTNRAVIDWRSFNVGSQANANFVQPDSKSIAVNRVNGSTDPTQIEGGIHANGQVWILNPNGVFFGKTAHVDAAGIVASTGNIDTGRFMAGDNRLTVTSADHGEVNNAGHITVAQGGLAAFVAPAVRNSGTIEAKVGKVSLAAGTQFTLDLAGDQLVEIGLGAGKAVVDQSGHIVAEGGTVSLSARAATAAVNSLINVSGIVSASAVQGDGGKVSLAGDNVTTTASAAVSADAGANGHGGSVTAVANNTGDYAGTFSAKGGSVSGDGGSVETSGHEVHIGKGLAVNAGATSGKAGLWSVDPVSLTIDSTTRDSIENSLVSNDVNFATTSDDIELDASVNSAAGHNLTLTSTGGHIFATGGSTINLTGGSSTLTLNVNSLGTTATSTGWVQDSINVIGTVVGGTTINLGAGTYHDTLDISKNITINGAGIGQTIIQPTALLDTHTGHKYDGDMLVSVYVHDASNVVLNGLTIDGNNLGNNAVVFWNNASGTISNSLIENPLAFTGLQTGQDLAVDATGANTSTLAVTNVTFQNWNKNAIDAVTGDGAGTGGGNIALTVSGSSFTGRGPTGTNAQNGIVLWERAGGTVSATVDNSTFSGIEYTDPVNATAAGILMYGSASGTLTVSNSTFDSSVQEYISVAGGSTHNVDATTGNSFGGVSVATATLAQLYAIEDKMIDALDDAGNGLVRLVAGHVFVTAAKGDIQAGVDAATAGDTINVQAGTYDGTLDISKNVTIIGAGIGQTIIQPTALLDTHTGHKYDADMKVSVFVHDAGAVTLDGLTIDGNNLAGGNAVVFWNNASGTISNSLIENPLPFTGLQTGQDLAVDATGANTSTLAVTNVTFQNWNKNAIDAVTGDGAGTGGGNIALAISGSTFTGAGATGVIAQNGIVLWERAGGTVSATVDSSTFSGIEYTGSNATAAGILVYGSASGTLTVSNSTFDGSVQEYIALQGGATHNVDATNHNTFDGVTISGASTLAQIYAVEDKLVDAIDDATNGLVRLVAGNVYLTAAKGSIQNAVTAASGGDTIHLQGGSYTLGGELDITKSLTIIGGGVAGTTITSNSTGYGINVTADNVRLSGFTFNGPTAVSSSTYGIKVTPASNNPNDREHNFQIDNVAIVGGYRTGLDLNGVVGATIDGVLVSNIVHGNGIALTDSASVTLTNVTTTNNAWGGLALYQTNNYYNQQLTGISVDNTNVFHEDNGVYAEDESPSLDMGSLTLAGYNYIVRSPTNPSDVYTFFRKTEQDAIDFADSAARNGGHITFSAANIQGWTGTAADNHFIVGTATSSDAMSLAAATSAVLNGGTVTVRSGSYAGNATLSSTGVTISGDAGSEIVVADNTNGINVNPGANNTTIQALEFVGPAAVSYIDYNWGGTVTRGIVISHDVTGFVIQNNNLHGLRNNILIDGRDTGSVINNIIDNSKSGISIQYTDGAGITIQGNQEGAFGNEWGLNLHLNGIWNGSVVNPSAGSQGTASLSVQQALLANAAANGGWAVQDQAYSARNRTQVTVGPVDGSHPNVTSSDSNQGSALGRLASIQAGVNAVVTGGVVHVKNGTYVVSSGYINVDHGMNLQGESEAGVIIDARNASTYGLRVTAGADNTTLENFTLYGSTSGSGSYGLKAENVQNLTVSNVLSRGASKSEFDFNGVIGGTFDHLEADGRSVSTGLATAGNGISFTDSQNIVLTNSTTHDNAWGGLALYQTNSPSGYPYQLTNITVDGTNTFNEANGIYLEDQSTTNDVGTLNLSGQGILYVAKLSAGVNDDYTFFQKTLPGAINQAGAIGTVQGYTGVAANGDNHFTVGTTSGSVAMSLNAATTAALDGGTIDILAGTYRGQAVVLDKSLTITGAGQGVTILEAPDTLTHSFTGSGFTQRGILSIEGDVAHPTMSVSVSGLTIDGRAVGDANNRLNGIAVHNANATINDVAITHVRGNPLNGAQAGWGVGAFNDDGTSRTISLTNSAISDFQKNGAAFQGGNLSVTVDHNTVTGAGDTGVIAQNGIEFFGNAGDGIVTGTINDNTVTGISYTGANNEASGILVIGGDGTVISNNTVTGTGNGYSAGIALNASNGVSVSGNTLSGHDVGVDIENYFGPTSNITVSGGSISDSNTGIYADPTIGGVSVSGVTFTNNDIHFQGSNAEVTSFMAPAALNVFDKTVYADGGDSIFGHLQAAIDDAGVGAVLHASADTFNEALNIGHDVTIVGAGIGLTIIRPTATLDTHTGHKYDADVKTTVFVHDTGSVHLSGMTIDGNNLDNNAVVFWNNASGSISNVVIKNPMPFSGAQTGQGLAVDATAGHTTTLSVTNVTFQNWNKNAIDAVTGDGSTTAGDGGNIALTVTGSTFTGAGATGVIAQNGILLWERAGGTVGATVDNSAFTGLDYTDPANATAAGILMYGSPNGTLTVKNSTFTNVQEYISLAGGSPHEVDATLNNTFDGVTASSSTSLDNLYAVENKLIDALDDTSNGLVRLVADQVYVTAAKGDIQAGVTAASVGNTIHIQAGSYALANELDITKSLTIVGSGIAGTTITSNSTGYGINVIGDNVTLSGFTFNAPTAHASSTYGIKVQPDTGVASDRLLNFAIDHVAINGGWRTGLDLNGVIGATIDHVTVTGVQNGNGIALTDSANVTLTNVTTTGDAWGGLALYQTNRFYDQQLTGISVDGSNTFNEDNGVYAEDESASLDMGLLSLAGYSFIVHSPTPPNNTADVFTFFRKTEQDAFDFATDTARNGGHVDLTKAYVEGWTGTGVNNIFTVGHSTGGTALSIDAAIAAAMSGATINVRSGAYAEAVSSAIVLNFNLGNVTVNSFTLGGGAAGSTLNGSLTANSIALNGAVALTGDLTLDTHAANGTVTTAAINGAHALTIATGTGGATLGAIGATTALTSLSISGPATLNGTYRAGSIALNGATTLGADTTLDTSAANGAVTTSSINGAHALTISTGTGNATLGAIGGATALTALNVAGTSTLTGGTYRAGSIVLGGAAILGADTTLDTSAANGAVTTGSINGARALTVSTGTGNAILGSIGATTALTALNVSGTSTLTGGTYRAGSIALGGAAILGADTTLDTSATNGSVTTSSVNGAHALTVSTGTGGATLGAIGGTSALTSLAVSGPATLNGGTYRAGSIALNGATTLGADTTLDTSAANGAVTTASINGAHALTVSTGTGNATLGSVGATTALTSLNIAGSSSTLNGGTYRAGSIVLGGAVSLDADTTLDTSAANGTVTTSSINGAHALTVSTGTGNAALGSVGATTALTALNVSGTSTLNGGTYRAGSIALGGGAILGADTTLDTSAANGAVTTSSINGAHALSVSTGSGSASLGSVGAATALTSFTVSGPATLNGGTYRAGSIALNGATTLGADTTLDTSAANGAITTASINGAHALAVSTGTGIATLGVTGGTAALTSLTVSGPAALTGGTYRAGTIALNGATTLGADTTLDTSAANGAITTSSINGAHALTVSTGTGNATLGSVGATTALTALSVTGTSTLNGGTYRAGAIALGGAATLGANTTLDSSSANGAIVTAAINASTAGGQSLTVSAGTGTASLGNLGATTRLGALTLVSNTVLTGGTYRAASFNAAGNLTLTAGSTTIDTTVSASAAGNISVAGAVLGSTSGGQSLTLAAGSGTGNASANGDIALHNVGTAALRLNNLSVSGDDFSAATVNLAGTFTSMLTGNQAFTSNTLNAGGTVNSTVGGNATGPINGSAITMHVGGNISGAITGSAVDLTANSVTGSTVTGTQSVNVTANTITATTITGPLVTANVDGAFDGTVNASNTGTVNADTINGTFKGGTINLVAGTSVNATVAATSLGVVAPNGTVTGTWVSLSTDGSGTLVINQQPNLGGDSSIGPNQLVVEGFALPPGTTVTASGELVLPQGLTIGLISPGGPSGKPQMILVHSVQRLGALLAAGYTAIVIDLDSSNDDEDKEQIIQVSSL